LDNLVRLPHSYELVLSKLCSQGDKVLLRHRCFIEVFVI